jgi:hypothetical protein
MTSNFDKVNIGSEISFDNVSADPSDTLRKLFVRNNNLYFNGLSISGDLKNIFSNTDDISMSDKVNYLFKKNYHMPNTNKSIRFFQEKYISSRPKIYKSQIWSQSHKIPSTAPSDLINLTGSNKGDNNATLTNNPAGTTSAVSSVIKKYIKIELEHISGSGGYSFKGKDFGSPYGNVVENVLPFNQDPSGSFFYELYKKDGTQINYDEGDWIFDFDSGILTFYSIDEISGVDANNPPSMSFYRYIGETGFFTDFNGTFLESSSLTGKVLHLYSENQVHITNNKSTLTGSILIEGGKEGIKIDSTIGSLNMVSSGSFPVLIQSKQSYINLTSSLSNINAIGINSQHTSGGINLDSKNIINLSSVNEISINNNKSSLTGSILIQGGKNGVTIDSHVGSLNMISSGTMPVLIQNKKNIISLVSSLSDRKAIDVVSEHNKGGISLNSANLINITSTSTSITSTNLVNIHANNNINLTTNQTNGRVVISGVTHIMNAGTISNLIDNNNYPGSLTGYKYIETNHIAANNQIHISNDWRIRENNGNLLFEKLVSGSYTVKLTI